MVGVVAAESANKELKTEIPKVGSYYNIYDDYDRPIIDESLFIGGDPPKKGSHGIDLWNDSYIILFDGRRGGGKTTYMSWWVVKSIVLNPSLRLVSNFPIEFHIRRHESDGGKHIQHITSEKIDFEKLLLQDEEYQRCIICIDEAPDIISHLAFMSWKNRLLNAFVRQIRKNKNSLFIGAQDESLIDKSMRWQVDVRILCQDMFRELGEGSGLMRGEHLRTFYYDESGQWTGKTTQQRLRMGLAPFVKIKDVYPVMLWGKKDEGIKPVFDTNYQIDLLESLTKVNMKLDSMTLGNTAKKPMFEDSVIDTTLGVISGIMDDGQRVERSEFYRILGTSMNENQKIGRALRSSGARLGGAGLGSYFFDQFDIAKFESILRNTEGGKN